MAEQHNEIVDWLEKYLESYEVDGKQWAIAKTFEETPDISSKLKSKEERFSIDKYAIDIICYREEKEPKEDDSEKEDKVWYYTFYIVSVNSFWNKDDEIDESLRTRLLFYQFYFSQRVITEPKAIRITVVVPSSLKIPEQIKINRKNAKDFFEEYGFGLWKVDVHLDKPEEIHPSCSLRQKMINDFVNAIDDAERLKPKMEEVALAIKTDAGLLKEQIKSEADEFALFFDQYVLDAIDAISGIKQEQIGKRYIDRKLIDLTCKCTQVEKIIYHNELCELLNEHLDKKEDEYDFTKKCFGKLWELLWKKHNIVTINNYPLILQEFEPFLQQFSKRYREHFVHQFQVFLLGTIIFDKVCDNCFSDPDKNEVEQVIENWLLASNIHDLTYPLQEYDKWSSEFFKKQLNINEPLSFLELSNVYVEQGFASRVEYIISQLNGSWFISPGSENKIYNAIRHFIYYEIVNKKNHGLMSASYLLNTLKKQDQDIIKKFLPAVTAMALHDDEIWQVLGNQINNYQQYFVDIIMGPTGKGTMTDIIENRGLDENTKNENIATELYEKVGSWKSTLYRELVDIVRATPLPHLCFEKQPVAFMLILCDNLQDSGRPCKSPEFSEMMELTNIRLKDVVFESELKELKIQMSFVHTPECSKFMADKKDTLEKMGNYLYSEKIKFIIEFWDSVTKSTWFSIDISSRN